MENSVYEDQEQGVPITVKASSLTSTTMLTSNFLDVLLISLRRLVIASTSGTIKEIVFLIAADYHELRIALHKQGVETLIRRKINAAHEYNKAIYHTRHDPRFNDNDDIRRKLLESLMEDLEITLAKISDEIKRM